jgi:hypothetical protein
MAVTVTERNLPGEARSADEVMDDYRQSSQSGAGTAAGPCQTALSACRPRSRS